MFVTKSVLPTVQIISGGQDRCLTLLIDIRPTTQFYLLKLINKLTICSYFIVCISMIIKLLL